MNQASRSRSGSGRSRSTSSSLTPSQPSLSQSQAALSEEKKTKVQQILHCCRDRSLASLVELATSSDGLVNDDTRRLAWPILLGCSVKPAANGHIEENQSLNGDADEKHSSSWRALPPHRDEAQVKLDVNRAFVYYPNGESEKQLDRRKQELSDLINAVLRAHPFLCYFQGYHDIVQVLLLVLGPSLAVPAVARLSLLRTRDFMLPSLDAAMAHLYLIPAILRVADPELAQHLPLTKPFFALSATLTLYAHDIQEYSDISRLFDFLIAHEAIISIYLFAVIIRTRKDELLDVPPDEPDVLHFTLSKLPQPLDLESLIAQTMVLYETYPPETLQGGSWRRVSSYSVLKTTRDPVSLEKQTLEDGETYFERQKKQMEREKMLRDTLITVRKRAWMYRRPASALGLAVIVGVVSWWLGRERSATVGQIVGTGILGFGRAFSKIMAFFT